MRIQSRLRGTKRSLGRLRIAALVALAALAAGLPAAAEMPGDESDDIEAGAMLPAPDRGAAERVRERLRRLERARERLDELKRTEHPFHSERSLRHRMRRNEAEQRRLKHERDRLEHERRRAGERMPRLHRD